ncbi:ribonuclease H family protein [Sphaerisporangium aureirubrum]|uniref:RNase H type-1 domain-containing protein n=1 Tax=Sphaerisporangium aureirubrum TaxID=1544736 RepID=A0ABW1NDM8_9ACTN
MTTLHLPILSTAGPYRAYLPWLEGGDRRLVATDGSWDLDSIGAWAVVRGDGRARYGWYIAERTTNHCAEIEAIRRALGMACHEPRDQPLRLVTDSLSAAGIVAKLQAGVAIEDLPTPKIHLTTLEALAEHVRDRPIEIHLGHAPAVSAKYSPAGLGGIADRLAWTALQLAVHDIFVNDPDVQRWLISDAMQHRKRRERLRKSWLARGPGRHLALA